MSAAPLGTPADRQAIAGAAMLADVEAELLGDDSTLRAHLAELAAALTGWQVAGDQAVAVHLRLAAEPHDGYEPADLDRALADYHQARGWLLSQVRTITDHMKETQP